MAARGRKILISAWPIGKYIEGPIYGTPKPGTVMSIRTPFYEGGQHLWEPFAGSSGVRSPICVLLEDWGQGKTVDDAYVTGNRGFMYMPVMGEELNMLIADVGGTGDTHAALEDLMVQTVTGKLIAATGEERVPFKLLQAITTALAADTLYPCLYTGS